MEKNIYCGRGSHIPYADYMDLINLCFGFETPEQQFLGLLPKLYREEYRPQDSNYVVTEDGVLTAAVGAFDHELVVCGRRLSCRGIGNVAVHPDHRGKGYMQDAMNAALRDMVADGIAISTLGGRRQRYLYFGYDKAGPNYTFWLTPDNFRHVFGDLTAPYTVRRVTDPSDPIIDAIIALNERGPVTPIRPRDKYLDIANTWKARLLVCTDGDRLVGYGIMDGNKTFSEAHTADPADFLPFLRSVFAHMKEGFGVTQPAYMTEHIHDLAPIAEGVSAGCAMHFNILNYRLVAEAFLALKLSYTKLPDGELTLLIHGYAGDERIRITVRDGVGAVETVGESVPVDHELTHAEAIAFLFSHFSAVRDTACDTAKLWFPLPICMYRADEV